MEIYRTFYCLVESFGNLVSYQEIRTMILFVISQDETLVRLQYNRSVTWKPADTFGMSCDADVSKYASDEQTCNFPIVPWNYLPRQLTILPLVDHVNMARYVPHNLWEIKDTAVWKPYLTTRCIGFHVHL